MLTACPVCPGLELDKYHVKAPDIFIVDIVGYLPSYWVKLRLLSIPSTATVSATLPVRLSLLHALSPLPTICTESAYRLVNQEELSLARAYYPVFCLRFRRCNVILAPLLQRSYVSECVLVLDSVKM